VITTNGTYPWSFVAQIFCCSKPSNGGDSQSDAINYVSALVVAVATNCKFSNRFNKLIKTSMIMVIIFFCTHCTIFYSLSNVECVSGLFSLDFDCFFVFCMVN
jgi:hypothetical protein